MAGSSLELKTFFCSGDTCGHRSSDTHKSGQPCVWEQRWAQRRQRKAGPSSWSHSYMSPASCVPGQFWWAPGTPGPPLQLWSWQWQEWSCQLSVCSGLDGNERKKRTLFVIFRRYFLGEIRTFTKMHLEFKEIVFIQRSMSGLKCVPPPCVCPWGECRSSPLSGWMLLQWSPCESWCHHPVNREPTPPPTVTQTEQQSVQIVLRTNRNKKIKKLRQSFSNLVLGRKTVPSQNQLGRVWTGRFQQKAAGSSAPPVGSHL